MFTIDENLLRHAALLQIIADDLRQSSVKCDFQRYSEALEVMAVDLMAYRGNEGNISFNCYQGSS